MPDLEPTTTGSALSFERAEFESQATPGLACGFCRRPIDKQYWQINKRAACAECRTQVQREVDGSMSRAHFLGALQYGVLAAATGSAAWIVVSKLTDSQLGIVAIGVGYLVGKAVRKGAGGFGGRRYQVLAMLLTYSAIALASLPAIFGVLRQVPQHAAASAAPGLGAMLSGWALILGIALASPFLGGVRNFMGLIIIGIGLYEAWKLTRAVPVQVLGPFAIQTSPPARLPLASTPDATD
ncbi:MAG TPA: hypothetical protein VGF76_23715 [Polyangiaceae bacterium]|jgi:hypothetical protein